MGSDRLAFSHLLPRPLAYVLGGGGARGAVQLGMLQALAATDLSPDLVVGTSAGALNGAVVAMDPDSAATTLTRIWASLDRQQVFPGGFVAGTIRATSTKRPYVFDPGPLAELMARYVPAERIEDLAIPYVAMATDLDTGNPVEIDSGDLRSAMLASSAIPVAYPWVERDGRRLVDGGLVANVPVRQAVERGARSVIIFDCGTFGTEGKWAEGIVGVLVQAIAIASRRQVTVDLQVAAHVPVVYLPVPEAIRTTLFDFESATALAEASLADTRDALAEVVGRSPDSPLAAGLYGWPPEAVLSPDLTALQR